MEIEQLRVVITEQDFQTAALKLLPNNTGIEDLGIQIGPTGITVNGVYQLFVPVSFETTWEMGVECGKATARLAGFRTMGMPTNVLKSLVMNVISDAAKKEKWLVVQGDVIKADVDALLATKGISAQTRLNSIRCETGKVTVEAGALWPPHPDDTVKAVPTKP